MTDVKKGFCRVCLGFCGIEAQVVDGRVVRVLGDKTNPITGGFTCSKGRAIPHELTNPARLLNAYRKNAHHGHDVIDARTAMAEAGQRLAEIVATHGPRSAAIYLGTGSAGYPCTLGTFYSLWKEMKSPMIFTPATIDQPGKTFSSALHGYWQGGAWNPSDADVWMFLGTNPMSTMWAGTCIYNPVQTVRGSRQRGMKVIAVDPRKTELARQADLHLPIRPGTDPALLAGLIRLLLTSGRVDHAFAARHTTGLEVLRTAVELFDLPRVAEITGLAETDIALAADYLASSRRGGISAGTGPNMSPNGTLSEYLGLCLQTLCGYWRRAGDPVGNPGVASPPREWREQASPRRPAIGFGEDMRVEGFTETAAGMPTALLPDEMLLEGPGRVRALVNLGGNPISAWPNESKVRAALDNLDLLITTDVRMSATAAVSHYVFATKFHLETPSVTATEGLRDYGAICDGFPISFGQYMPALSEPPIGSDLIDEWELFVEMARAQSLPLMVNGRELAREVDLTSDGVLDAVFAEATVKLEELRPHPGGKLFPSEVRVQPTDESVAVERKLDLGNATGLTGLASMLLDASVTERPFRLICRRMRDMKNSWGDFETASGRHRGGNPLWMHPVDIQRLELSEGDRVEVCSDHGAVRCQVLTDANGLTGVVSMSHGFGVDESGLGVNVNRLTDNLIGTDRFTGMPVLSALPVTVTAIASVDSKGAWSEVRPVL